MDGSILTQTKKILGIEADYTAFDVDIIIHINSVFSTLSQVGIGPSDGFMIYDAEATWEEFIGVDFNLNLVKTYVYLKVKLLFDPPASSFGITAMKEEIKEIEWRLNVHRETTEWRDPTPIRDIENYENVIVDGGAA